jgi:N-hydroxyarylamine O-acetyltransferase
MESAAMGGNFMQSNMNEDLYEPIPDLDAYFTRLGISRPEKPTKAALFNLINAHQRAIAYENLDIHRYQKDVLLGTQDLFDKIILRKRGGFCFELSTLFSVLLKDLGYDVYSCKGKVFFEGVNHNFAMHRCVIVRLEDGDYYCDVAFGGPVPSGPVKFEADLVQEIHGEAFVFRREPNDRWWRFHRVSSDGKEIRVVDIDLAPVNTEDFVPLAHYASCRKQRMFTEFTDNLILNIRTDGGHYSIMNDSFVSNIGGVRKEHKMESDKELRQILQQYFNMEPPAELQG